MINKIIFLFSINFLFISCAEKIFFKVERQPEFKIEGIEYLEIGSFKSKQGIIKLPASNEKKSFTNNLVNNNQTNLMPKFIELENDHNKSEMVADLVRAKILDLLSTNLPWIIINTTGKETGYSGVIPEEKKIFDYENTKLFVTVENKGTSLEQQILSKTASIGIEKLGAGFSIPIPYVESIAAIEIDFFLKFKNGKVIVPKQNHKAFFVKKWGGGKNSSHIPINIRNKIINDFQKDDALKKNFVNEINITNLAFEDPDEYLSKGYNLKKNNRVPLTTLDIMIRLSDQVSNIYFKQISPYYIEKNFELMDGDINAINLIKANAFFEAISYLRSFDRLDFNDKYNLALAYEASGQFSIAKIQYKELNLLKSENRLIKEALNRLK